MSGAQQLPTVTTDSSADEWESFWAASARIDQDRFQDLVAKISVMSNIDAIFFLQGYLSETIPISNQKVFEAAKQGLLLFTKSFQPPPSVSAVLQANSRDDNGIDYDRDKVIQNILVNMDGKEKRAYFIASNGVSFRHQGDRRKKPTLVYLRNLQEYEDKALLYYTSSGSGKTVELAGSSVTRNADLTFILQGVEEEQLDMERYREEATEQWEQERNTGHHKKTNIAMFTAQNGEKEPETDGEEFMSRIVKRNIAMNTLIPVLVELIAKAKRELEAILQAAEREETPLRIVLAIDEGSTCPITLRGLLRAPDLAKLIVEEALLQSMDCSSVKVAVCLSIAGTGVSSSSVGSIGLRFQVLQPNCELGGKAKINKAALEKNETKVLVPWSTKPQVIDSIDMVRKHIPVVAALMENGRMASIAIAEIAKYKKGEPVYESKLVDTIIVKFMKANGLAPLVEGRSSPSRYAVAAAALAVHLFGGEHRFRLKVPEGFDDLLLFSTKMDFFPLEYKNMPWVDIKTIVAIFGLLEPSDVIDRETCGKEIPPPLTMNPAQQLVAAHMLGIDLADMLEPSWIGFEVLATHSVKCAIAASMAVTRDKRPSLRDTLSCVGFRLDDNATSESVKRRWKVMECCKAVSVLHNRKQEPTVFHTETRQLRVGLRVDSDNEILQVDKVLHETLFHWKADGHIQKGRSFAPPVACINHGNSSLPDGFVTFFVGDSKDIGSLQKWTIMVQGKDYHDSGIDASGLNKHAERAGSALLDGLFGEKRLLCVASSHSSLAATRKVKDREFLPFHIQESDLFKTLLQQLKEQRSEKMRIETYACFCNQNGDLVENKETQYAPKSIQKSGLKRKHRS